MTTAEAVSIWSRHPLLSNCHEFDLFRDYGNRHEHLFENQLSSLVVAVLYT
jgi:hypothetical protein